MLRKAFKISCKDQEGKLNALIFISISGDNMCHFPTACYLHNQLFSTLLHPTCFYYVLSFPLQVLPPYCT